MTGQQVFSASSNGVAVVETDTGQGSAFVVEHRGGSTLLLTNAHVVEGAEQVRLRWQDGGRDPAEVVASAGGHSPATDLALLAVEGKRGVPLRLGRGSPPVGAQVYVIGAPRGLDFSLSSGVVSQLRDDGEILQTDAAINQGNSGGPLLDERNCVVGVATFILRDAQGLNFAVTSRVIEPFLAGAAARRDPSPSPQPAPAAAECFFRSYKKSRGEDIGCTVRSRTNVNGHRVYDVAWADGYESSYVFWDHGEVEILSKDGAGEPDAHRGRFTVHSDGVEITSNEGSITFLPRLDPQAN